MVVGKPQISPMNHSLEGILGSYSLKSLTWLELGVFLENLGMTFIRVG